jgi:antitoxin component of MazEF toxin-antitoxin module
MNMEAEVAELKLTAIGNSVGVILPPDMLARLGLERAIRCTLLRLSMACG